MDSKPNCTLYVNNINEKIKKDELKKSLFHLFSQFGPVLDIVALKTMKMRGQAFIVFKDVASATSGLRALQGCPFYNKPMKIAFAQTESEATQKRTGTFRMRKKEDEAKDAAAKKKKEKKTEELPAGDFSAFAEMAMNAAEDETPNKILFVSNLPSGVDTAEMVSTVFSPHDGFKEVRLVPGRQDIVFVEFETELQASTAKDSLHGYRIKPSNPISISYAKR
ncbi:U1 small nuclear ribonucleoprotein A-like [Paramacrobiotus metropolitanus]|uniref:U1 small nuclear ribonucleoprotein A-like n=1 Tax=Paramacrobiotus metropolitanus TaxID=2943436 RepID=UPI002445D5AE|nr:U1 small nuclear ribonucleoprotein A-like [Paramacrobiotus metropolitanus]XP_055332662.1 U1 small nuclear ribonucleoprotein A-like [Paramacrobiotus metropolitanus]